VLVTGGLGFIGSELVRRLAADEQRVLNVDLDTYAGDERRLAGVPSHLVETVRIDVASAEFGELVRRERPRLILHLAAESHVTRSERAAELFHRANVDATRRVLEAAMAADVGRVVHMSTDEIYGPCPGAPFTEADKRPGEGLATSPYARSKALADDLALGHADRVDVVVARATNCIGPWQHPEKAVPRWITRALRGQPLPVWGDGMQVRDWMHVSDAVSALLILAERGTRGTAYNVGPGGEGTPNLEIARMVARQTGLPQDAVYLSEYDRPGHDRRYAVDASRVTALGWRPQQTLERAIAGTIEWYRGRGDWWEPLVPEAEALYAD
jgi:dTDP-glucose 4,6-dehydratase